MSFGVFKHVGTYTTACYIKTSRTAYIGNPPGPVQKCIVTDQLMHSTHILSWLLLCIFSVESFMFRDHSKRTHTNTRLPIVFINAHHYNFVATFFAFYRFHRSDTVLAFNHRLPSTDSRYDYRYHKLVIIRRRSKNDI